VTFGSIDAALLIYITFEIKADREMPLNREIDIIEDMEIKDVVPCSTVDMDKHHQPSKASEGLESGHYVHMRWMSLRKH
jgi:hypothetical protein